MAYTPSPDFSLVQDSYTPSANFTLGEAAGVTGSVSLALKQTVVCIGSASLNFTQTGIDVGNVALAFQQSVADTGIAFAAFEQTISGLVDVALAFEQTVAYPVETVALVFTQAVADTGSASLSLSQNVYDPDFIAAGWANWDVVVSVNDIDVSADLVETLTIEAERSAARIADFTLAMSGVVTPADWAGKSVAIDYKQNNGATWRRFTGVIDNAEYNISTKTLRCLCSDDLQNIIDGHSRAQLDALVGGHWSSHVFNDSNQGWDYLQDLLKTVYKTVEFDSNRQLTIGDLNAKAIDDYSFDESLILDESLAVQLAQRNQLVNRVDIEFQARYRRLHHVDYHVFWQYPETVCDYIARPVVMPNQSMVQTAVEQGGWKYINANITPLWPTRDYFCGDFINTYPDGMRGFAATAGKRWQQTITDLFQISVTAPASIDDHGELSETVSASLSADETIDDWGGDDDNYAVVPAGFSGNGSGHFQYDDVDDDDIGQALSALLNEAAVTILQSHQQNGVRFQLPLAPYIELNQTLHVDDSDVAAIGIIKRFSETYDFNAGTPITEIELAISAGGSGLSSSDIMLSAPPRPTLSSSSPALFVSGASIDTHIGGRFESPTQNEAWTGMALNQAATEPGGIVYDTGLKIPFPAIDAAFTDNSETIIPHEIKIAVPDNTLTITA